MQRSSDSAGDGHHGSRGRSGYRIGLASCLLMPLGIALLATPARAQPAARAEVEKFVHSYFDSWSKQNMDAYESCFMDDAIIQYVDSAGRLSNQQKRPFVAGQRAFHRRSKVRTVEYPVSMEIRFERQVARAVVYWKLQAPGREEYGYDHFTLLKTRSGWRIAHLLFYGTPKEK